ncbi:hypothetical protein D9756_001430 [Leucocoprinus leucothites]|uniref:Transmembrane protein n=1 Tax=Leucocoprinus leucothites TaxID=201217 RepID=A0A8H5LHT7_9AGAR|nr:hypothetical protein D9756_001430 [Leucoagaricus leucothites]
MAVLAYLAIAFLPGVLSQAISNAFCTVSSLTWTYNSLSQSPCEVAANLAGVCNGGVFTLDSLDPGFVYLGPSKIVANSCRCSTVYYSMLSACAACQGNSWIGWAQYSANCTTVYDAKFPQPFPSGITVPAWAYADIAASNNFSLAVAQSLESRPDSSAFPSSTSGFSFPTGGSSFSYTAGNTGLPTFTPVSNPNSSNSSSSNAGAIAGGVIGGVVGLALVAGLAFFFLRRRREATQPASSAFSTTPYTPAPYNPDSAPNMSYTPDASTAYAPSQTQPQRLYDPSDPSTFPTTPAPVPTSPYSTTYTPPPASAQYNPFQGSSPQVAQPHMPPAPGPAGHYTGAPEL